MTASQRIICWLQDVKGGCRFERPCVKLEAGRRSDVALLADVHEDHVRRRARGAVVVPAARVDVALDRLEAPAGPGLEHPDVVLARAEVRAVRVEADEF